MTFMSGQKCQLRILEESDEEAKEWTRGVMGNINLKYLLTGSIPMRWIDVKAYWKEKREKGAVHFGIWTPTANHNDPVLAPNWEWRFIGVTGLYDPYEVYRSYEFRIIIFDSEHIAKGIGQEATWMVTDYAFRRMNSHRVWLGVNRENSRAVKCYENVGYQLEGVLRDAIYCNGKYNDVNRYAMLRPDWMAKCEKMGVNTEGPAYA